MARPRMFGPSAPTRLHVPAGPCGSAGERPSRNRIVPDPISRRVDGSQRPDDPFQPSTILSQLHPNESSMFSLRNLRPALIAPLHAAVPVLIHDEFLSFLLLGESEIVCAGITTANRRYFSTFAESPSDRTAGRDALVAAASTSGLPPRARRTIRATPR
jgi:hypothetical protein